MTASVTADQSTFSARLKAETAARHDKAEHSTFMEELMGGKLDTAAYLRLINQYVYIYRALEEISAHFRANPNPVTDPFVQEGLDRLELIKADIAALGQEELDQPLEATQAYVADILATRTSPQRFLAHHYLRYLGDLSGGQAVAVLVGRHYGLGPEALSMYRFDSLPKPKVFKDSYRSLLDQAPLSEAEREELIDEALKGFDHNAALFAQLGRG